MRGETEADRTFRRLPASGGVRVGGPRRKASRSAAGWSSPAGPPRRSGTSG